MTNSVFRLRASFEEDRPSLLNERENLPQESQRTNYAIYNGDPDVEIKDWIPFDLRCDEPGLSLVHEWDCFHFGASSGAFSRRAVDVLRPLFDCELVELPVLLEDVEYFIIRTNSAIDCLDKRKSFIKYFDAPLPKEIMTIYQYRFRKDILKPSMIFSIPEQRAFLFATDLVPELIAKSGLKGIAFEILHGPEDDGPKPRKRKKTK